MREEAFRLETGESVMLLMVDSEGSAGTPCRLLQAKMPGHAGEHSAAWHVAAMLTGIGVPSKLLGYDYLRTGLLLLLERPVLGRSLTKGLYPRIAQEHEATTQSVERAIRHAIELTWQRGGAEAYRQSLGRWASPTGDRPTNAEFLSQVAESIRMRRMM
ncbi:MAG: sporulation initiation factor Spo0A C-terminal domain-containing protein [Clostridia bacterium]|nr:sporulation initiation factor Spo0A C-terminal domain-containing protein [Clostridia bacterium]